MSMQSEKCFRLTHNSQSMTRLPFRARLAAPSFVWSGDIALNCHELQSIVDEVGLLLFEADSCLAYTEKDLPAWLAELSINYHAHLPLDLPWAEGLDAAWEKISGLVTKIAYLRPRAFVLHPPPDSAVWPELARRFADLGVPARRVLLENVREDDLIGRWELLEACDFGVCLDLGHALAYNQGSLPTWPGLTERLGMLHLNAPGPGGRHLGLDRLDEAGLRLLTNLLDRVKPETVLMIEVFSPAPFLRSLALVRRLMRERRRAGPPA